MVARVADRQMRPMASPRRVPSASLRGTRGSLEVTKEQDRLERPMIEKLVRRLARRRGWGGGRAVGYAHKGCPGLESKSTPTKAGPGGEERTPTYLHENKSRSNSERRVSRKATGDESGTKNPPREKEVKVRPGQKALTRELGRSWNHGRGGERSRKTSNHHGDRRNPRATMAIRHPAVWIRGCRSNGEEPNEGNEVRSEN